MEQASKRLTELETIFHTAWTKSGTSPFIADIPLKNEVLAETHHLVRQFPTFLLFKNAPTIAVWSVLRPLSLHYGGESNDVYPHIESFFDKKIETEDLKLRFRKTAKNLGLPVSGNKPTELFFYPLGPARHQMPALAEAFVVTTILYGPPAIEDTAAARRWQRRAVADRCPGLTRLKATIAFDSSAWCARRFEAWRQGHDSITENEGHLFEAYDAVAKSYGRKRRDLVGPPQLCWSADRLALQAEPSPSPQRLKLGAFPSPVPGGGQVTLPGPWPDEVEWSYGPANIKVQITPAQGEVLVFDADTERLLARVSSDQDELEVAAAHLVVLAPDPFESQTFGPAISAKDPAYKVAWVEANETLRFDNGRELKLCAPREEAVWVDGTVIGRDGGRALYPCDADLRIKIDPEVGGSDRIIRMRMGAVTQFLPVTVRTVDPVLVPLSDFGLSEQAAPGEAVFDVLVPGAIGDVEARAALSTRCWVWPGLQTPEGDLSDVTEPDNLVPARCAGLMILDGTVSVDPEALEETPILGLAGPERTHEFRLAARGEKLWHNRIESGARSFVPRGAVIVMGHVSRHDTLTLRSPDRTGTLLVLGREFRKPFFQRQTIEIGADKLQTPLDGDDRIALKRDSGRVDVLARVQRRTDPAEIVLSETPDQISLSIALTSPCDALRILIEDVTGEVLVGETGFSHRPVEVPPLPGTEVGYDPESRRLSITLKRRGFSAPARASFQIREEGRRFEDLRDARNARIAIGLSGAPKGANPVQLAGLARLLAEPEPDDLSGQLRAALTPAYAETIKAIAGTSRLLGPIRGLLGVVRTDGGIPRHDLVAVAPWLFEAQLQAFSGISPATGLAPLSGMAALPTPDPAPDLAGDDPLGTWLSRVSCGDRVPREFQANTIQNGFRTLRWRLRETDLYDLVRDGPIGTNQRLLSRAYVDDLDRIRSFDVNGGGDPVPARIAVQIERFARACALARVEPFIHDAAFRTGLSVEEVGFLLSLTVRAGIELFAYFRALWAYSYQDED
jgi:hypothetical protein